MADPQLTPDARFADVVRALIAVDGVTYPTSAGQGKAFGSDTLKVQNKIFAMLVNQQLVVKLPKARVEALIEAGFGTRFEPGHGRVMKEWLAVPATADADWIELAREARGFVNSTSQTSHPKLRTAKD